MDLGTWLRELGLEQYENAFRDSAIDAEVLGELTDEHLKELGLPLGHRLRLLKAIAALHRAAPLAPQAARGPEGPLPGAEGERRQVTVLFADLAGYTALSSALDPEEVHALLERFFARVDGIVEEHGGRSEKHIGDCVMAVFGAPLAHGNDAERAVRAALAIRDTMAGIAATDGRSMQVHIGVASGEVVASGTGSASYREYTVTGESVNLASRLTDAAAAGEILVSDWVRHALADKLDCGDPKTLAVKGFSEPVRAWRLVGLRSGRRERRAFVGRQNEVHQFEAALAALLHSGRGQAIYIRGEAGIGKSRLAERFQEIARAAGFACHAALVLDFGAGAGRDAIAGLVRGLLGLDTFGDAPSAHAAITDTLARGLISPDDAPFLNDLLDLAQSSEQRAVYNAMDNATHMRGKQRVVNTLVERLSRVQPRLLVIEDVHWADRATLEHLADLVGITPRAATLVVMTSRPENDPLDQAWRARTGGGPLITIDLGPLPPDDARALASGLLAGSTALAERCVERAAGNPLFLEQLIRHAAEGAADGVPGSVRSLVQARLDRLDPGDKEALRAASVLGQRFAREPLTYLLDRPDYDPESLVEHALIRPQADGYLFAHALIRDGVYESLLKTRRRALHRRAADWYAGRDAALRAEHLDRAEDPAAARAYLEAAQSEAGRYHHEQAAGLAARGLALAQGASLRHELACLEAELLLALGRTQESVAAAERALAAAQDDIERCRARISLAEGLRILDRYDEALRVLRQAQPAASRTGRAADLARIHHLRGNLFFPLGRLKECLAEHEASLRYANAANSPEDEARALGGLGDAEYVRGRMLTAGRHFRRCVEVSRGHGFARVAAANANMAAFTRFYMNDIPDMLEDALAAIEAAAKIGHLRAEMIARHAAHLALLYMGALGPAKEQAEVSLGISRRLAARRFEAEGLVLLADLARLEGRSRDALSLLKDALAIFRATGMTYFGPTALASLALTTDDPQERRRALEEGESILERGAVSHNYFFFYRDAIDASLEASDWDEALRYAAALETYARPEPLPWSDFVIARGRALAAFGRGEYSPKLIGEIRRLRDEAERAQMRLPFAALEAALTASP